ncbi:MAG TPA: PKD domain-containing protein [Candidatus Binatia bacterium]|nr:PKD domain-containing protein [Candidatus Binatia bacterium]
MRIYAVWVTILLVFSSLSALAGTALKATTTLAAETSNNTSAADSFATQTNGNIGATNISKAPVRSLLYPGSTAKIYAHLVPWFGFGDHMSVGYVSNDTLQVQKQVNDMLSRGLDGAIIDWYGRGESNTHFISYDQATQGIMHQAELHPGFSFAIMHDAGALKVCANTLGCDVTQTLIDDLNYVNVTYEGSPAYLRSGGRPVIYFFGHEAYTIDWTRVRAGVAGNPMFIFRNPSGFTKAQSSGAFSWVEPTTVTSTNLMAINYMDSYYKTALSLPSDYSTGSGYKGFNDTLASWGSNRIIGQQCGQTWLDTIAEAGKFYSTTNQMLGIQLVTWNDYEEGSEIETGIDNCVTVSASVAGTVASWNITGQMNTVDHFTVFASQDGANLMWLADVPTTTGSLDLATFGLNAGNYTIFVKAVGKASLTNKISGGVQVTIANQPPTAVLSITNSLTKSSVTGSVVAPASITASTAGSTDADGSIVASTINFGDGSAPVSGSSASHTYSTAGTYTITGTVTDNLGATASKSAAIVVSSSINQPPVAAISATPGSAYAPATVSVSAAGSSDPDGTIANSVISFGDGTSVSGLTASHKFSAAGVYTLTATVTDNLGASSTATTSVTVKAPEVIVSSPAAGALLNSQVHVVASGFSGYTVTTMQIYVDGTIVYSVNSANLDGTISVASGAHTLTIKGWDVSGRNFYKQVSVTINKPPVAALTLSSGSILRGGSITASASTSSDPDGSITSTVISFGDGSSVTAASASHQYKVAGTYTVKATVTDNMGASSSTSSTVVVKAPFVTITSPTFTSTTSTSVRATGTSSSGYPVVATQVYLDGVLKYQSSAATADTTLPIAVGTHQIVIQGWDSTGATFKSAVMVTRQ